MDYPRLAQFSQVKTSSLVQSNANKLFTKFKMHRLLNDAGIVKDKGYSLIEMLFMMLLLVLETHNSVFAGISGYSLTKQIFILGLSTLQEAEFDGRCDSAYLGFAKPFSVSE